MDFIHLNQRGGRRELGERNGRMSTVFLTFAYSVSFLNPESSSRENLQSLSKGSRRLGATFLEAPGQRLACGNPMFLSHWGHRGERLVGLMGTSVAVGGAALSPSSLSVRHWYFSQAVQVSPHPEESLCGEGLGWFLWMCSGLFQSRGSEDENRSTVEIHRQ